jgi:rhombotail lipoprotein
MKWYAVLGLIGVVGVVSGCAVIEHGFCAPNCKSQIHNSSSLVSFLYSDGNVPPPQNAIPELPVPLRVGLAFLPSQAAFGDAQLDEAHKQELLERIRKQFLDRKFVSDIVIIPDYYLTANRGFTGLEGVQRLYNIDLMALVSYDQVTYSEDNRYSLAYLTIVGAYIIKGSINDTTTLVDLAVVDPKTRSLVLRAGGPDTHHDTSTLVDAQHKVRVAGAASFDAATNQMIVHFDSALTAFEADVHAGKANVRVVARNAPAGGGGSLDGWSLAALLMVALLSLFRPRPARAHGGTQRHWQPGLSTSTSLWSKRTGSARQRRPPWRHAHRERGMR